MHGIEGEGIAGLKLVHIQPPKIRSILSCELFLGLFPVYLVLFFFFAVSELLIIFGGRAKAKAKATFHRLCINFRRHKSFQTHSDASSLKLFWDIFYF